MSTTNPLLSSDTTGAPLGGGWGTPVENPLAGGEMHHFDGVPGSPTDPTVGLATPANSLKDAKQTVARWRSTMVRVRQVEGPRGTAVRVTVVLRWIAHVLVVILAAALVQAAFGGTSFSSMGTLLLFSAAVMAVTGALGTMFIPTKRPEIIEEFRHCLFHLCLAPAVAFAAFNWVLSSYIGDARNSDQALSSVVQYLPLICAFGILASGVVFVKLVSGRRHIDRSTADDAELMATWTRQDNWVR